jgi:hypothetical protein
MGGKIEEEFPRILKGRPDMAPFVAWALFFIAKDYKSTSKRLYNYAKKHNYFAYPFEPSYREFIGLLVGHCKNIVITREGTGWKLKDEIKEKIEMMHKEGKVVECLEQLKGNRRKFS